MIEDNNHFKNNFTPAIQKKDIRRTLKLKRFIVHIFYCVKRWSIVDFFNLYCAIYNVQKTGENKLLRNFDEESYLN